VSIHSCLQKAFTDFSFLFTLEEFGREVLFLLSTVEEVSLGTVPLFRKTSYVAILGGPT
jgi:hypothetical protein